MNANNWLVVMRCECIWHKFNNVTHFQLRFFFIFRLYAVLNERSERNTTHEHTHTERYTAV